MLKSWEDGSKAGFYLLLSGGRDASNGSAVEGLLEADDVGPRFTAFGLGAMMSEPSSEFNQAVIGFRS